jgi:hypothetical protein
MSKAYVVFYEEQGLVAVLGVGKWSCMGAFLFLESVTIVSSINCTMLIAVTKSYNGWC